MTHSQSSTRILVLGAGYAGLLFTMRLARKTAGREVEITLVNESETFTQRMQLHEYATNHQIEWRSIPQTLKGTKVQFLQGRVTSLDPARREIVLAEQQSTRRLAYDSLVYALGSQTERQSVPGVAQYAYTLTPRGPLSAEALCQALPAVQDRGGQVVICGAGATGIETAAEVAAAYPAIKVHLLTAGSFDLFPDRGAAAYIRRRLSRLGVNILDQTPVASVQAHSVVTRQGKELAADVCIWTGGFVAPPLAREAGIAVNERNQVIVDPFLRSLSHPEIYAIGDAASPREDPGVRVRMAAATAIILGAHGADCLSRVLRGKAPRPLSFAHAGQGIALGPHHFIGFSKDSNDRPVPPYFTGRLGSFIRELGLRYFAASASIDYRFHFVFWLGKRRYAAQQRRARWASQQVGHLPQEQL